MQVFSPFGDLQLVPKIVTKEELHEAREVYDVIVLTCKAFDLPSAMEAIAPAVGEQTVIVPCSTACAISTRWSGASAPATYWAVWR